MKKIVETERLYLREFDAEHDAESAYELNKDPEVMQYTGDVPFGSIEEAEEFLENYTDYQRNGMGRWAVIRKKDDAFLGWCGLKKHEDGMIDLGFRFMQKYWNKGYATEAAKACIDYGFEVLAIKEIIGRAAHANSASIQVLEKCGMDFWKKDECKGIDDSVYYRIRKVDQF